MYLSFDDSSNPSLPNIYHSMLSLINSTSIFIYFDDTPIWQIFKPIYECYCQKKCFITWKIPNLLQQIKPKNYGLKFRPRKYFPRLPMTMSWQLRKNRNDLAPIATIIQHCKSPNF